jgi:hypothetical protein
LFKKMAYFRLTLVINYNCCVLAIIIVDLLIKEESIFFASFAHYFLHCNKENPES